jgi:hypothetical protein
MKKSKRKVVAIVLVIVLAIILIIGTLTLIIFKNESSAPEESELLSFDYRDEFSGFQLFDNSGNEIKMPEASTYNLYCYLSDKCGTCIDVLKNYEKLSEIFNEVNVYIIWKDSIPLSILDKYDINADRSFSLSGKVRLSNSTPTMFLVDSNNQLIFKDIDMKMVASKIVDLSDRKLIKDNANNYILSNLFKVSEKEKKILYFTMNGCKSCEDANKIIQDYPDTGYEIVKIYSDSYSDNAFDQLADTYSIYAVVYGISSYPSFLIYNGAEYSLLSDADLEYISEILMYS